MPPAPVRDSGISTVDGEKTGSRVADSVNDKATIFIPTVSSLQMLPS